LKLESTDEQLAVDIINKALEQPIRALVKNAGEDDGYILRKIEESKDVDFGYNVMTGEFGSMTKFGVLDPLKVTRSAFQNATSVAMMVLTTECLVTEIKEEHKEPALPQGGMGGMDY
jgi:chaperonin GroEL